MKSVLMRVKTAVPMNIIVFEQAKQKGVDNK